MRRVLALVVPLLIILAGAFGGGAILLSPYGQPEKPPPIADPPPDDDPPPPAPTCTLAEREAAALALLGQRSFARVGAEVRWDLVPTAPSTGAFVTSGARSPKALEQVLRSSSELRQMLNKRLTLLQMSQLSADDFVAVQPLKPLVLKGNYILKDGRALRSPKTTLPGEALWVYVDHERCLPQGIALLVVCANPVDIRKDWVVVRE